MAENLLQRGLELTAYGMGTVFVFLVMLIFATRGMSRVALRIDASQPVETTDSSSTKETANKLENKELIAVITAAISQYRASNNK
jgi:oxaloacetate decarboxylase gamma subunit